MKEVKGHSYIVASNIFSQTSSRSNGPTDISVVPVCSSATVRSTGTLLDKN